MYSSCNLFFKSNTIFLLPLAPSSAPPRVRCEPVSSTEVRTSWGNIPDSSRNGLIRGYTAVLTDSVSGEQLTQNASVRRATFSNLISYRAYRCKVAAYTVALGPYSTETQVTTLSDGIYDMIHSS